MSRKSPNFENGSAAAESPPFVWEVWNYGGRKPSVKRYQLVKVNRGGGVTVLQYGRHVQIKRMTGKQFLYDEQAVAAYIRRRQSAALDTAHRAVQELTEELGRPDCGVHIEEVRAEPLPERIVTE